MAEFQTSFIPKKSFDGVAGQKKGKSGMLFFTVLLVFIFSLLTAGAAFAYEQFLNASISHKKDSLEKVKSAFEPELIRQLSHLDQKLHTARTLLDSHVALSSYFELLESVTLESIRFKTFSYIVDDAGIRVTMQGEALSFASVALQSDEFAKQRFIKELVFSGLELDEKGNVIFTVTALVDPQLISYRDRVARGGTAVLTPSADTLASDISTGSSSPSTN